MTQTEPRGSGVGESIGLYLEAVTLAAKMRDQPEHDEQAVLSMLRECEANIDQCVRTSASSVALDISKAIHDRGLLVKTRTPTTQAFGRNENNGKNPDRL